MTKYWQSSWHKALLFLLVVVLSSCRQDIESATILNYNIKYILHKEMPSLAISVSFTSKNTDYAWVKLPSSWANQNDLLSKVSRIEVEAPARLINTEYNDKILIAHGTKTEVKFRYTFIPGPKLPVNNAFFPPLINQESLHLIGALFLAIPLIFSGDVGCKFHWEVPDSWDFASSFGLGTDLISSHVNYEFLSKSLFVGGLMRVHHAEVSGQAIKIIMKDKWSFVDEEFISMVKKIIYESQQLFGALDTPYFLVNIMKNNTNNNSVHGVALTNGFSVMASSKSNLQEHFGPVMAHEYIHNWNGGKITNHDSTGEGGYAWFIEGFTEYFSWIVNLRAGIWSPKDFVNNYNQTLYEYNNSLVNTAPNDKIEKGFWRSHELMRLPYIRGALIARRWDALMRNTKKGHLIDLMRALIANMTESTFGLTRQLIESEAKKIIDYDFGSDMQKYAIEGQKIPVDAHDLGPCMSMVVHYQAPLYERKDYYFKLDPAQWNSLQHLCTTYLN